MAYITYILYIIYKADVIDGALVSKTYNSIVVKLSFKPKRDGGQTIRFPLGLKVECMMGDQNLVMQLHTYFSSV